MTQKLSISQIYPPDSGDEERKPDGCGTSTPLHNLRIVRGVNSFPVDIPQEDILLGRGWLRRSDIATFISTAGAGKSVAMAQAAMAWSLGLPYMGIQPSRPLKILHFVGEDDETTLGQCREGFLEHSKAITGRQLTLKDLEALAENLRTDFSREYVGTTFHVHLSALLSEDPADLVLINPLLSYVGGEIVTCASDWLRVGLMPVLQKHSCGAMIAHHTGKMTKDSWDQTEDIYAGIGGGEMANVPRAILVLRPTGCDGLSVIKVGKRQTTGWRDHNDDFTSCYFVQRSGDPERPAWLPVPHDEAEEMISEGRTESRATGKKATLDHVVEVLEMAGGQAINRQALIEKVRRAAKCSDKPARDAIKAATQGGTVTEFEERNPNGGKPIKWFCLPEHKSQWVK
jgi:hypothetical protein